MAHFDIIIRGGTVVDGTRTPRYTSDIAIKDGKIAKIGGLNGNTADKVLDAKGRIVAPGFVDLHTHYDAQIFWDPYCTLSGWAWGDFRRFGQLWLWICAVAAGGPGPGDAEHDSQ